MRAKNCTILFLDWLCQTKVYFDNFWQAYTSLNFLSQTCFIFSIKSKAANKSFQQHSVLAQRVCTTVKLFRRKTPDFIIAPNLWLLNISDFTTVDYRILAMPQEWVCQHPLWSRWSAEAMSDRQTDDHCSAIDRCWFRLRVWVMVGGGHLEQLT